MIDYVMVFPTVRNMKTKGNWLNVNGPVSLHPTVVVPFLTSVRGSSTSHALILVTAMSPAGFQIILIRFRDKDGLVS